MHNIYLKMRELKDKTSLDSSLCRSCLALMQPKKGHQNLYLAKDTIEEKDKVSTAI